MFVCGFSVAVLWLSVFFVTTALLCLTPHSWCRGCVSACGRRVEAAARAQAEKDRSSRVKTAAKRREDEAKRFLEALRAKMIHKIKALGMDLPPLCGCPG